MELPPIFKNEIEEDIKNSQEVYQTSNNIKIEKEDEVLTKKEKD